jgi:hypothetical protein
MAARLSGRRNPHRGKNAQVHASVAREAAIRPFQQKQAGEIAHVEAGRSQIGRAAINAFHTELSEPPSHRVNRFQPVRVVDGGLKEI